MKVTQRDLEAAVERLNRLTGHQLAPYTKLDNGKHVPNAGNYHLDYAYSGVKLVQMCDEGTGIKNVLSMGYETKKNCYNAIHSYIKGIEDCILQEKRLDEVIKGIVG